MPVLNWLGKDKIINHHSEVPYKVLNRTYSFDENGKTDNDNKSENMIIHGDNLLALKSLLPKFENMVDVVYIDPPYNTAHSTNKNQKWVYSDNVDSPIIQKWLGQVVGDEGDDLSRHDKWLCMMYPRLQLLYKLLSERGVIFISCDDNELFNLKNICDEIFNKDNYISLLSVENNPKGRKNSDYISITNDYVLIYVKNKKKIEFVENVPKERKEMTLDENGNYIHASGKRVLVGENSFNDLVDDLNSDKHYSIYYNHETKEYKFKKENEINEVDNNLINAGFQRFYSYYDGHFVLNTYTEFKMKQLLDDNAIEFKNGKIYEKNFSTSIRIKSILQNEEYIGIVDNKEEMVKLDFKTTSANTLLKKIFNTTKTIFPNPKNIGLLKVLITLIENKKIIVLDSFAGSGTTAHAVLDLNNKDGGNRKFILIEMEDYADSITAERVKKVINGYGTGDDKVDGLKGDFSFYELGDTIFENGILNEKVDDKVIRQYIYWTETKKDPAFNDKEPHFLGVDNEIAYYMYYKKDDVTTLDTNFLKTIKTKSEKYVIYADILGLTNEELKTFNITFKKIPRDIKKI